MAIFFVTRLVFKIKHFKQVVFVLSGNAYMSFNFEGTILTIVVWIYVKRYRGKS